MQYICFTTIMIMSSTAKALSELFNRIPRRHNLENVKAMNEILAEYEDLLITIEAANPFYEKSIPVFFDDLERVRYTIKKSNDNKASKKLKDSLFDEGSGTLKESIQTLIDVYADGKRTA